MKEAGKLRTPRSGLAGRPLFGGLSERYGNNAAVRLAQQRRHVANPTEK